MDMTVEELRNFLKVVETGSATTAAEERYISRQGLRSTINSLEKELGAPLLKRTSRGFALTEFGRFFASEAAPFEKAFSDLSNAYKRYQIKTEKTIKIAMGDALVPWTRLIRRICTEFLDSYPGYQVEFQTKEGQITRDTISEADRELVLLQTAEPILNCEEITLLPTEYMACIAKLNPLSQRVTVTIEDLRGQRFVTRSRETYIYEWLHAKGIPDGQIIFDSSNPDVKRAMIETGLVVGFSSTTYLKTGQSVYGTGIRQIRMYPPNLVQNTLYVRKEKLEAKDAIRLFWSFANDFINNKNLDDQ